MSSVAQEFKDRVSKIRPGVLSRSTLNIRNGAGVIENLLQDRRYDTILEIGTFRGVTSAFMAQFCERVITIDLRYGELELMGQPFNRQAFWRDLGVSNIELHLVGSDHEKYSLIPSLGFDLAFIDGDHMAPAPERDFEAVRGCGAVLFHDYDGQNHVTKFVDTLPRDQVTITDIFALWKGEP